VGLHAKRAGIEIRFSDEIDRRTAADAGNYAVKTWSLKRTASYGSKHYDERALRITAVQVAEDGKSVLLKIPDVQPTQGMEIKYGFRSAAGEKIEGILHSSVHRLAE
jgi:hypothetical protein